MPTKLIKLLLTCSIASQLVFAAPVSAKSSGWSEEKGPADASQVQLLAAAVAVDARSWHSITYDRKSLRNFYRHNSIWNQLRIHADFTYNGGSPGWVDAEVIDGQVHCLEYWDSQGLCNEVRTVENLQSQAESAVRRSANDKADCRRNHPLNAGFAC
jgi:hypothetical protein